VSQAWAKYTRNPPNAKTREIVERTGADAGGPAQAAVFQIKLRGNFAACAGNAIASISREQTTLP
jgi:hypothetical protein